MIKGVDAYHAFLRMNEAQKKKYLLENFPWYCIFFDTNEVIFNPNAFAAWYEKTNFIEKDLWFKALTLEQQKAVHQIWFGVLNGNSLLQKYSVQTARASTEHDQPERKNLARPSV